MLNDVQAYFDATTAAQEAYTNAADTCQTAKQAAWDALKDSDNRMVAFIAQHAESERQHAEAILRVLPATEAQIVQVARDGAFNTGVFEGLLRQAREAGVIDPVVVVDATAPHGAPRADLERWARGIAPAYVTDRHIADLMGHVDRVVAAER